MGDSPAAEFLRDQRRDALKRKRATQDRRAEMLCNIFQTVGFGEHDGDLSPLERDAAEKLRIAYEAFRLLAGT